VWHFVAFHFVPTALSVVLGALGATAFLNGSCFHQSLIANTAAAAAANPQL